MRTPALFTSVLSLALCALAGAQDCPVASQAKTVSTTECPATCDGAKAQTVAVAKACTDEPQAQTVAQSGACSASACDATQPVAVVVKKAAPVALFADDEKACAGVALDTPSKLVHVHGQDVALDDVTNAIQVNHVVDLQDALKNIEAELVELEGLEGIQIDVQRLKDLGVDLHGLGDFAIVVDDATTQDGAALGTLRSLGYVGDDVDDRGYLGVYMELGDDGMTVTEVMAGGPAESMGIQKGDRIVQINDRKLSSGDMEFLAELGAGDKVTVVAVRGDKKFKAKGKLQTLASIEGESVEEVVEDAPARTGLFRVEGSEDGGDFDVRQFRIGGADAAHGQLKIRVNGKDVEVGQIQNLRFGADGEVHVDIEAKDVGHGGHGQELEIEVDVPDGNQWQELRTRVKNRVQEHSGGGQQVFEGKHGEHFIFEFDTDDEGHGHDNDAGHAHDHEGDGHHAHDDDTGHGEQVKRRVVFRSDDGDTQEFVVRGGGNVWFGEYDDDGHDDGDAGHGEQIERRIRLHGGDEEEEVILEGGGSFTFGGGGDDGKHVERRLRIRTGDGEEREIVLHGEGGESFQLHGNDAHDVKVEKRVELKHDAPQARVRIRRDGDGDHFVNRAHGGEVQVQGKIVIIDGSGKRKVLEFDGEDMGKLHEHLLQLDGEHAGGNDGLHGILTELHGRHGEGAEGRHRIMIQGADGKKGGLWVTPDVGHDVLMWDTRAPEAPRAPRMRVEQDRGRFQLRGQNHEDDDHDHDDDDLEERLDDLQDEIRALRREIRELKGLLRRR